MLSHPLVPIINGLGQGSVLFLVALGLSLTLGVMRLLNISNGAFYMLGAYFSTIIFTGGHIHAVQMIVAILLGGLAAGAAGAVTEVVFIRRLYPLPHLFPLLGTYAVLLTIQGIAIVVWGIQPRPTQLASEFNGRFSIGSSSISVYDLLLIGTGLLFAVVIGLTMTRTRVGRVVGAVADDRTMASALGINTKRVFMVMFAMSAVVAGIGGGLTAPLNGLTPDVAATYVIEAFAVVIVGGAGSVLGTYIASITLGVLQSILVVVEPSMSEVSVYIAMALMMLVRPQGLFGRRQLGTI